MKNSGVSEILGGLLAVVIVFSGMGIVGVYLTSTPPPEAYPQISFLVHCCSDSESVNISHQGGDAISRSDIEFKLYLEDGSEAPSLEWDKSGLFKTGDNLIITANPPFSSPPERLIIIKSGGANQILLDTEFMCFDCNP